MKIALLILFIVLQANIVLAIDDPAARAAFSSPTGRDVAAALKKAATEKKRLLVVVSDPKKKQAVHIQATMQANETKQLVKEHLLVVVTDPKDKNIANLLPDVGPVHPAYILFEPDGSVAEKGDFGMGPNNGLNAVKKWTSAP